MNLLDNIHVEVSGVGTVTPPEKVIEELKAELQRAYAANEENSRLYNEEHHAFCQFRERMEDALRVEVNLQKTAAAEACRDIAKRHEKCGNFAHIVRHGCAETIAREISERFGV